MEENGKWKKKDLALAYVEFQKDGLSPFHVVSSCAEKLEKAGFIALDPKSQWRLEIGQRYFVGHEDGKSLIAFGVGQSAPSESGFALIAAHTDSPVLRLRLNPWVEDSKCVRLLTQTHGGLIDRSWFDRPLVLAGMVYEVVRQSGVPVFDPNTGLPKVKAHLVRTSQPVAVIPDLAIHLDRQKSSQGAINAETMLTAIVGVNEGAAKQKKLLQKSFGLKDDVVIDGFELALAPYWPHTLAGLDHSLIVGPRHDDLAMVFAGLCAILALDPSDLADTHQTPVVGFFDGEETGSRTCSGAASSFMRDTLLRIARHHPQNLAGRDPEASLARSFLISADMAHAYHPSYPEKFDQNHQLKINAGLVIKENSDDRYATSGYSGTIMKAICEAAKVPVQGYVHRQDLACGSTVGPILAASLNCLGVDVGTAMWSMHSTAETMGTDDLYYAVKAFYTFFAKRG